VLHPLEDHPLRHLFRAPRSASRRSSSWDRSGRNHDYIRVAPGETATLLEHDGAGCTTRFYVALAAPELSDPRRDPALLLGR
jgi:D-arabinan exo alpha-(1,3)/(1,5)-arabinofuranosidase (non-reducing end)